MCFIGDGIHDAIAMRQADVSISLRGATTAATDTAQISAELRPELCRYHYSVATGLGSAMKPQLDHKKDDPQWCTDRAGFENAPVLPLDLNQTT